MFNKLRILAMISNKEYLLLKNLAADAHINKSEYASEIDSCLQNGFIGYNYTKQHGRTIYYDGFGITIDGHRAIEEFELSKQTVEQTKETLKIANDANRIAEDSNKISQKANILSIFAMIISGISIIATVGTIIVSLCK